MVVLFTLYTDFSCRHWSDTWLSTQINLLPQWGDNIVRWSSGDNIVYSAADLGPICSPHEHFDARSPNSYATLDRRYHIVREASVRGETTIFIMKNGRKAYRSLWPDALPCITEIPILLKFNGANTADLSCSVSCQSVDRNPFQIGPAVAKNWRPDLVIDMVECGFKYLEVQDRLRAIISRFWVHPVIPSPIEPFISSSSSVRPPLLILAMMGPPKGGKSEISKAVISGMNAECVDSRNLAFKGWDRVGNMGNHFLTESQVAHILFQEIELEFRARPGLAVLVIEITSFCRALPVLKTIFDDLLHVVYVDADKETRQKRHAAMILARDIRAGNMPMSEQDEAFHNDSGDTEVRKIADFILHNNGALGDAISELKKHLHPVLETRLSLR
ncbi:hypothetical protein NM688_g4849 [Phlebia brevispora]|uniref:Uncharacterized protein n=1 Tax=Phlebia brevispora TaxID=194682 RepID=A0ACC1T1P4_9APHY|nr:hypothetical protein NM688_g4849 [Phlebia brevispora]